MRVAFVLLVACASTDPETTRITLHTSLASGLVDRVDGDAPWVAVRDGDDDASWNVLAGNGHGEYQFDVTDRYVVAIACSPTLRLLARAPTETKLTATCNAPAPSDAHVLEATLNATEPITVRTFLLETDTGPESVSGAKLDYTWRGRSGLYDVIAFAHSGDAADQILIARDLDITKNPVIDLDPRTAKYQPLGPSATTTAPEKLVLETSYVTRNGTFVRLGDVWGDTLTIPTFPTDAAVGGDIYYERAATSDGTITREADRFVPQPSTTAATLPKPFDAELGTTFDFVEYLGADRYTLACDGGNHSIINDISTAWLGREHTYALPIVPKAAPVVTDTTLCRWQASALGGIETRWASRRWLERRAQ